MTTDKRLCLSLRVKIHTMASEMGLLSVASHVIIIITTMITITTIRRRRIAVAVATPVIILKIKIE